MSNKIIVQEFEIEEEDFGKKDVNRFYRPKKQYETTTEAIYDNWELIQRVMDMLCSDQLLTLYIKTDLEIIEIYSAKYAAELADLRGIIISEVISELDQEV